MTIARWGSRVPRVFRFAVVGGCAAAVHFSSVIALVEFLSIQPAIANIYAFLIAFNVSFLGQRFFTFHDTSEPLLVTLPRYFLISLASFVLNEFLFSIAIYIFQIRYYIALAVVVIFVAILTYILSKRWAFLRNL